MLKGGGALNPDGLALDLAFALDRSFTTDPAAAGAALITSRRGPTAKFSRGSGATQVNAAGLIEYAPENLLTRSEEFNDAYWTPVRTSVGATQYVSPIGSITADKIIADSTPSANHRIDRASLALVTRTTYTVSVFAKAAEYTGFGIGLDTGAPFTGVQFDLTGSGSITLQNVGFVGSITSVGDGWFRCTATITSDPSITSYRLYLFVGQNGTTFTFTGDGTSGIFLWGAQLERASTARTYCPTTSAVFYGPRFDHDPITGICKGLLIEEQRTNLIATSVPGTNWTSGTGAHTVTQNSTDVGVAPDGSLPTKVVCTTSGNYQISFAAVTGTQYTASIYARVSVGTGPIRVGGIIAGAFSNDTATSQWARYSKTDTSATTGTRFLQLSMVAGETIYIWGAQVEAGAFPLSYIPTTIGTAARSADVCSIVGTDFSSFYNQVEGTLAIEVYSTTSSSASGAPTFLALSDGTINNAIAINRPTGTTSASAPVSVSNSPQFESGTISSVFASSGLKKLASAYKTNDLAFSAIGGSPILDTSASLPTTLNAASIGTWPTSSRHINGHIARITYFRKRLSNAKLQTITAP